MNKLAVIADSHGNSWALKAVLGDIRQRGISDIADAEEIPDDLAVT